MTANGPPHEAGILGTQKCRPSHRIGTTHRTPAQCANHNRNKHTKQDSATRKMANKTPVPTPHSLSAFLCIALGSTGGSAKCTAGQQWDRRESTITRKTTSPQQGTQTRRNRTTDPIQALNRSTPSHGPSPTKVALVEPTGRRCCHPIQTAKFLFHVRWSYPSMLPEKLTGSCPWRAAPSEPVDLAKV